LFAKADLFDGWYLNFLTVTVMQRRFKYGVLLPGLIAVPVMAIAATHDASEAFKAATMKMHGAMPMQYSGNTDVDFVKSMIPHHQGAIDMAEVELKYGTDPQARKFAEAIIKAQKAEIEEFNKWLQEHGN
jgi:uncharacterized protein (DUF305 family)